MIMLKIWISVCVILFTLNCKKENKQSETLTTIPIELQQRKAKFTGNYNREFNDLNSLHIVAAIKNGITPLATRADTIRHMDDMVRLPDELEL